MGLVRIEGKTGRQIGQRAAVTMIGDDLEAVLARGREARARGPDRIKGQRPGMRGEDVLAVADEIQGADLPIRLGAPAMRRRQNFHRPRRARQKRLEIPGEFTEIIQERNDLRVPAIRKQSLEDLDPGDPHQAKRREIGVLRKVPIEGRGDEPSVPRIGPAVIRAHEMTDATGLGTAQLGAAMTAAIEDRVDAPIVMAHDHDGGAAKHPGHIIARRRNLALMREIEPRPVEDPIMLEPVNFVGNEDLATDEPARRIDPFYRRCIRHRQSPQSEISLPSHKLIHAPRVCNDHT